MTKRGKPLQVTALKILLLGSAFALRTVVTGWWAIPILGATWGLIGPNRKRAPLLAAVSAGWGWVLLLLWNAWQGSLLTLANRAAGVMGMGGASLLGITVAFSMVLAWAAAVVAGGMRVGSGKK
jgi:hypothetical protein